MASLRGHSKSAMPMYALRPPDYQPEALTGSPAERLALGEIMLLRPWGDITCAALTYAIRHAQRSCPAAPVGIWLDLSPLKDYPMLSQCARKSGVRIVVARSNVCVDTLRHQATSLEFLADDVRHRFAMFGLEYGAPVDRLIKVACEHAASFRTVAKLAHATGLSYSTLRRACSRAGLCSPSRLYQITRMLLVILDLQRQVDTPASIIARTYGYWDDAALRARMRAIAGVSPSAARKWLGWEPCLLTSLCRTGIRVVGYRSPGNVLTTGV